MDTAAKNAYTRVAAAMASLAIVVGAFLIYPTPWSPMGQANTHQQLKHHGNAPTVNLNDFDFPEGWGPTKPGQDQVVVPDKGGAPAVVPSDPSVRGA